MCACKNNTNNILQPLVITSKPDVVSGCDTTLEFLNYLVNLINLNLGNEIMSQSDRYLLQVYKGQVLSGINLTNYCYTDYKVVETNVFNVISKYI